MIKLNGGLGTSMGMTKAKSLLEVKDGRTFLDLIAEQILDLRERSGARLPLVLMNSFATQADSLAALRALRRPRRRRCRSTSSRTRSPSCAPTTSRRRSGRMTRRWSGRRPATATSTPPW